MLLYLVDESRADFLLSYRANTSQTRDVSTDKVGDGLDTRYWISLSGWIYKRKIRPWGSSQ